MNFHQSPLTYVQAVTLQVTNLDRSLLFYQDVLGFTITEQTKHSAALSANGQDVLVQLEQPSDVQPKAARTTGLYHFALLLPNRADLARLLMHFTKLKIEVGGADHLVSEAIYLADPDGNGIEVYIDRNADEWTWHNGQVKMTVDPLQVDDIVVGVTDLEGWTGLPSDTVMGHIHLHVSEFGKIKAFYNDGLGFEVVSKLGSEALFVSTGNYHHHIGLNTWNGAGAPRPAKNSVGLQSYTIMLPSETVRDSTIAALKRVGAPVERTTDAVITEDPSGNRIHLRIEQNGVYVIT